MAKTKRKRSAMPVSKATNAYELLAEIRQIILEEPKRYDQNMWLLTGAIGERAPACGTVGCVAGWAVALKADEVPAWYLVAEKAQEILGLGSEEAGELFSSEAASTPRERCYGPRTRNPAHARRGAAHIRRFMEKYKDQLKAKGV